MSTQNPAANATADSAATANTIVCRDASGDSSFNNLTAAALFVTATKTPSAADATGTTGQICWDADYLYVCVDTNTWLRAAIITWP